MRTVVLGAPPAELAAYLARRRALGQDLFDEVWEGEYHVAPAPGPEHGMVDDELAALLRPYAVAAGLIGSGPFNLGEPGDYRVPDRGYHRTRPREAFVPTAALVVEILSPDDETFEKFGFYARHGVDEILVADPRARRVTCHRRDGTAYREVPQSDALGVGTDELTASVAWP